jgi:S-adenosyl-L-methionine hydrolase (adenosine-forming)
VVKAVIRDLAPHVGVIDLTHEVPPFDVRAGSLALARCIGYVPSGVVLAVVDPAVGTDRRAVAVEVAGGAGVLIGPDNGLLAPAVAMAGGAERAVELTNPEYRLEAAGATFAGRDVFAPAAAHVCNGVDLAELGPEIDPALMVPGTVPLPRADGDELVAEVLWVDRFGNCQLNVGPDDVAGWDPRLRLRVGNPGDPTRPAGPCGRHRRTCGELRRHPRWWPRVGARFLRDARRVPRPALGGRGARGSGPGDQVVLVPLADEAGADPSNATVETPVQLGRHR